VARRGHRRALATHDERDTVIRRGQLEHLLTAAARPDVTIQVLPFAAGLPPVTAGSFPVLGPRATSAPDVVHLETKPRVFSIDAEAEVHRYTRPSATSAPTPSNPAASLP
jgi:hypothetical protein